MESNVKKVVGLSLVFVVILMAIFINPTSANNADYVELNGINICYIESKNHDECQELPSEINHFYRDFALVIKASPKAIQDAVQKISRFNIIQGSDGDKLASYSPDNNQIYFQENFIESFQQSQIYDGFWLLSPEFIEESNLSINFQANNNLPQEFNYRLAKILYHEIGHYLEAKFMVFEPFHCLKNKFPELFLPVDSNFCISNNGNKLALEYAFNFLNKSPYSSFYSTCSAGEDFAETLSASILVDDLKMNLKISNNQKVIFDLKQHLEQNDISKKTTLTKTLLAMQIMPFNEARQHQYDLMSCDAAFEIR